MLVVSFGLNILASILTGMSNSWQMYFLGRLVNGFFQGGMFVVVFMFWGWMKSKFWSKIYPSITTFSSKPFSILNNEYFDKSLWAITGSIISAAWGFGFIALSLLGQLFPNWRDLLIYSSLPFIPLLIFIWAIFPESPLWLCSVERYAEAEVILKSMAKYNGRSYERYSKIVDLGPGSSNEDQIQDEKSQSHTQNQNSPVKIKQYISKAIYNSEYRSRLKGCCFSWLIVGISSYYLTYSADHLGGTVYANLAFQGLVEIIVDLSVAIIFKLCKRKPAVIILWSIEIFMLLFMAISPYFLTIMQDTTSSARLIFAVLAKGSTAAVFCSFWIYTSELFPTSLRTGSQGLCSMCARIGAMLSPLLFEFGDTLPLYILAVCGVLALMSGMTLPETFGQKPLDRLEDLTKYARLKNKLDNKNKVDYKQILLDTDDEENYELANISDDQADASNYTNSPARRRIGGLNSDNEEDDIIARSGSSSSDEDSNFSYARKKNLKKKVRKLLEKNSDGSDREESARMNRAFDDSNIDDTPRKMHSWI